MFGYLSEKIDLDRFDALVVHYTLVACSDDYIGPESRARIAAFPGLKAAFVQDEYRHVNRTVAALRDLGVGVLFTCVPEPEIEKVYPRAKLPGVRKVNLLTGYVPPGLADRPAPAFAERPIDVGYRARPLPAWLGELGQEKHRIAVRFAADADRWGLRVDISDREEDRLYGDAWTRFLCRSKAVLGTESGASVFDFEGDIQARVEAHLRRDPGASFETLRDLYFAAAEGRMRLNQISPRCFEAACLRCLMILYEGAYSGVLEPWRHYVPLAKDHGNMAEVVAVLRDPARAQAIVDAAYREIARDPAYSYAPMVATFDRTMSAAFAPAMARGREAYSDAAFARDRRSRRSIYRQWRRRAIEAAYRRVTGAIRAILPAAAQPVALRAIKAVVAALRRLRRRAA